MQVRNTKLPCGPTKEIIIFKTSATAKTLESRPTLAEEHVKP